jgi:hypothetical protein
MFGGFIFITENNSARSQSRNLDEKAYNSTAASSEIVR